MRLIPSLLFFVFAFARQLLAQGNLDPITTTGTIPSQSVSTSIGTPTIDLRTFFAVPTITGQVVQFTVPNAGVFNVKLDSAVAPATVANFLAYVSANRFANTMIHRSNPGFRILQGGGYSPNTVGTTFSGYNTVVKNAALAMEAGDTLTHERGTIAMARQPALDTATSEWFINTVDNSSTGSGRWSPASALNNSNINPSYAVFGRVAGTGMSVVDAIAALPVLGGNVIVTSSSTSTTSVTIQHATVPANFGTGWGLLGGLVSTVSTVGALDFVTLTGNADRSITTDTVVPYTIFSTPFDELPLFTNLASPPGGASVSTLVPLTSLVKTTTVNVVPVFPATPGAASVVTFSALSSDPNVVKATISGSNLILAAVKNQNGSATVTVTATDTNGNAVQQTPFNVSVTRKVVDFNSDGIGDFVFQNNSGQILTWYLNASGVLTGSAYLYPGALGAWRVVALADMNGDGNQDIVLQYSTGQIYFYNLNASGAITSTTYAYPYAIGDWQVVAAADINRDGKTDLLFQNSYGQILVWYMNGSGGITSSAYLYTGLLGDWRIKCTADYNGDGIPDLVFQNGVGQIVVWYLTASGGVTGSAYLYGSGTGDWKIARATDVNGDGISDLLFQNTAGQILVWFMNASGGITSSRYLYTGGLSDWRLH